MGEAVVTHEKKNKDWKKKKKNMEDEDHSLIEQDNEGEIVTSSSSSGMVCWENYVTKMVLRVLLVEADDSTRHIITALLRKCSYRVAAVSDGLMAWETLKGKPHNIDLVLTEVELPSISGYALLTLVMEHDVCKNIPVVMMSSHDSIGMVLKCILKGAADFLVKPIRKNELRNLWQHVWRRQSLSDGLSQSSPVILEKVEATSENHVPSNHSSICTTSSGKIHNRSLKENNDVQTQEHEPAICVPFLNVNRDMHTAENEEKTKKLPAPCNESSSAKLMSMKDEFAIMKEFQRSKTTVQYEVDQRDSKLAHENFYLNDDTNRHEASLKRETSFEMYDAGNQKIKVDDQRHLLNHSQDSAFSWYSNKISRPFLPTPAKAISNSKEEDDANLLKPQSDQNKHGAVSHHGSKPMTEQKMTTVVINQSDEGTRLTHSDRGHGRLTPSICYPRFRLSSIWSPEMATQKENPLQPIDSPAQNYPAIAKGKSSDETLNDVESMEEQHHIGSSVWTNANSFANHKTGNDSATPDSIIEGSVVSSGNDFPDSHRKRLREAALAKFRLKRKERCFEKKVRYQSRQKLAEQRPRIKGQFVRQVQAETPTLARN